MYHHHENMPLVATDGFTVQCFEFDERGLRAYGLGFRLCISGGSGALTRFQRYGAYRQGFPTPPMIMIIILWGLYWVAYLVKLPCDVE